MQWNIYIFHPTHFIQVRHKPKECFTNLILCKSEGIFRQKALATLKTDELKSIYYLAQSHCLSLQFKAALQYDQLLAPNQNVPLTINKANIDSNCNFSEDTAVDSMIKKVSELPKGL